MRLTGWLVLYPAICILCQTEATLAQPCHHPSTRAWVRIEDANNNSDTLWFGFDSTGTCGVDPQLCELTLAEPCGAPADLFCVFWFVGNQCAPQNQGTLVAYNYYGLRSPTQIDTFKLRFFPGPPNPRYPMKISWRSQLVSALYDSAVIRDYHYGAVRTTPMSQTDSLTITDTLSFQATIMGWHPIVSSASSSFSPKPMTPILQQNFPNPFNPSTTIEYLLPVKCRVTLKVFDLLGQEIAVLVNAVESPGRKSLAFNAGGLATGVYYYRLQAGDYVTSKKLLLLR
jgi:hypothetical protein